MFVEDVFTHILSFEFEIGLCHVITAVKVRDDKSPKIPCYIGPRRNAGDLNPPQNVMSAASVIRSEMN